MVEINMQVVHKYDTLALVQCSLEAPIFPPSAFDVEQTLQVKGVSDVTIDLGDGFGVPTQACYRCFQIDYSTGRAKEKLMYVPVEAINMGLWKLVWL